MYETDRRYRALIEGMPDLVIVISQGRIVLSAPLDAIKESHGGASLNEIFVAHVGISAGPGADSSLRSE